MKKKFYFATLVIAALSFTGCANDEYVGDQQKLGEQNGAIAFSTKSTNTVRANLTNGAAAEKLHNQFWVYGTKTVGENDPQPVFKDYKVVYDNDNANKSTSNTKGWEYVGIPGTNQTIKYWDYSASQYDFEAYSISRAYINNETGQRTVTRNKEKVGEYIVSDINQNDCATLYFAKKNTVNKNSSTEGSRYQDAVKLEFKSVLSKIRVGFYETIPGYSVKITAFYPPSGEIPTDFNADNKSTNAFVAWCPNKKIDDNTSSFVVTYDDTDNATPAVTMVKKGNAYQAISSANDDDGYKLNSTLTLGNYLFSVENIGKLYSEVTWDNVDRGTSKYTYVIPQNQQELCNPSGGVGQVQPMKIKVDYTLTSDDDSQEKIHVKGATAIVPKEYVQWAPNTAYSYVFKISDNTNGTTGTPGTADPAGLYPITFDAVVTEMDNNRKDYLTTVSDLSITATQGKQFDEADKAVFKTGEAINVKVMMYDNTGAASDITNQFTSDPTDYHFYAAFVTAYDYDKSQEDNLPSGTSLASKTAESSVITLEGKSAGFWIVKVTYKDGDETITKYAVLKVGIETPSTSGNG